MRTIFLLTLFSSLLASQTAAAQDEGAGTTASAFMKCARIANDAQRLSCYDRLATELIELGLSNLGGPEPAPPEPPHLSPGGRTTRAWILISDDDSFDDILERLRAKARESKGALEVFVVTRKDLEGDLGEPVLGDADRRACFTSTRAEILHLGNRETFVVCNHHDARAFEDLAEFVDQLFFLCSIHSFTPSLAPDQSGAGSNFVEQQAARQSTVHANGASQA